MQLNEEQTAAVQHPIGGAACLIAGAGSGKTRVLTERVRWLIQQGVPPKRICAVTFTNRAAHELISRLDISPGTSKDEIPRASTIHSLALTAIRRNPQGFGLQGRVTPIDDYDQSVMMKKIIDRKELEENQWAVLEKIAFHRAKGLCFSTDYTSEVHALAQKKHGGFHALDENQVALWKAYEEDKRTQSVVDFDDMLHLVVHRGQTDHVWHSKLGRVFEHVLVDEAQDLSPIQWEFVSMLLSSENRNMYAVGDMSQCHPPGTKIKVQKNYRKIIPKIEGSKGLRSLATEWMEVPIENLQGGELTQSWTKKDQMTYQIGRKIQVASRPYRGPLIRLIAANGNSTRVTPNHWVWVRFSKEAKTKHIVYLMYRSDLGFRIGRTPVWLKTGGFGLTARMNQEKAERAWALRLCSSRAESEAWEEILSLKFGIPESCFTAGSCVNKNQDLINLVFSYADPMRGLDCLLAHNLLFDFPLSSKVGPEGEVAKHYSGYEKAVFQNWRGYVKTVAANVIPGLFDIPLEGQNKSILINNVEIDHYEGQVYSLDVEKDHTYIADGLVVGNSIMSFNGSAPELLKHYSEGWRDTVPTLYRIARNHRSVPEVVSLANATQKKMTDTIPLQMESWRGTQGETGSTQLMKAAEPRDIAAQIVTQINHDALLKRNTISYKDNAILVRSGKTQVRDIEAELVKRRIPYIVRGGMSLLQTEEVRDILSYLRLIANPFDFTALVRATSVPKRGVGPQSLERIREKARLYNNDLIAACQEDKKLTMFAATIRRVEEHKDDPVKALEDVLRLTDYHSYLRTKYAREPERVRMKIENLDRFQLMLVGLLEDNPLTLEDIVFQLTLDRAQDEKDTEGKVTISTIHSAKGLEWKRVYVTNCYEGSLPHKFSMGSLSEIEEERRLFYVACTRARDILVLCVPAMVQMGPNTHSLAPSRFLYEVGVR